MKTIKLFYESIITLAEFTLMLNDVFIFYKKKYFIYINNIYIKKNN